MCTLSICVRVLAIKRRAGGSTLLRMAAATPGLLVTVQRSEKRKVVDCWLLALSSPIAKSASVDALHAAEHSTRRTGPQIVGRMLFRIRLQQPSVLLLVSIEVQGFRV